MPSISFEAAEPAVSNLWVAPTICSIDRAKACATWLRGSTLARAFWPAIFRSADAVAKGDDASRTALSNSVSRPVIVSPIRPISSDLGGERSALSPNPPAAPTMLADAVSPPLSSEDAARVSRLREAICRIPYGAGNVHACLIESATQRSSASLDLPAAILRRLVQGCSGIR